MRISDWSSDVCSSDLTLSLTLPPSAKIYLSLAPCDMRKGFDGLSAQVRNILQLDPFSGAVFLFRGKRGDRLKALVWDGSGLCLYAKRLERRKLVWTRTQDEIGRASWGEGVCQYV